MNSSARITGMIVRRNAHRRCHADWVRQSSIVAQGCLIRQSIENNDRQIYKDRSTYLEEVEVRKFVRFSTLGRFMVDTTREGGR